MNPYGVGVPLEDIREIVPAFSFIFRVFNAKGCISIC